MKIEVKFILEINEGQIISEYHLDEMITNLEYKFDSDCIDMDKVSCMIDSYSIVG